MKQYLNNRFVSLIVRGILALSVMTSSTVFAAGFQISETSVAGLGRGFAGQGLAGDSISEMYANPASLALREGSEVEFAGHLIMTNADFQNKGSSQSILGTSSPATGGNSDGGGDAIVPNLFYARDMSDRLRAGVGITAPFGLTTEYDATWVGRYVGILSELTAVDINPMISYDVGAVKMGFGINVMFIDATLTRALLIGPTTDGLATVEGDDTAVGWNVGFITEGEAGRFGIGYRSEVDFEVDGTFFTNPNIGINTTAHSNVTLPQTVYVSGVYNLNEKTELLGSIRWTGWDAFQELRFRFDGGLPDSVTPENWKNSMMFSVGFNHIANEKWVYRGGLAYDESPVSDQFRTVRIPDADRLWLTLGGSYTVSNKLIVDIGYAHIFADSVPLNEFSSSSSSGVVNNVTGRYTDTDANIISLALKYKLGQ